MDVLFDENIGKPIVNSIAGILQWHVSKPKVTHIVDLFGSGVTDDVWIREISGKNYLIISGDRAKRYGGPKLPQLCLENKIMHILFSASLQNAKQFERARALIATWPEIYAAFESKMSLRFGLQYNASGNPTLLPKI